MPVSPDEERIVVIVNNNNANITTEIPVWEPGNSPDGEFGKTQILDSNAVGFFRGEEDPPGGSRSADHGAFAAGSGGAVFQRRRDGVILKRVPRRLQPGFRRRAAVFSGVGFSKKCLQFAGKYDIILSCQKTQLTEWMDSRVAKGDRL